MAAAQGERDCDKASLRRRILGAFPAYSYAGQVMAVLHDPSEYESEADNLDVVLAGKKWTELEEAYVDANSDDYVLMAPLAVQAFLPAWLSRAADDLGGAGEVLIGLIFHIKSASDPQFDNGWARGLALFTKEQAYALRTLLE